MVALPGELWSPCTRQIIFDICCKITKAASKVDLSATRNINLFFFLITKQMMFLYQKGPSIHFHIRFSHNSVTRLNPLNNMCLYGFMWQRLIWLNVKCDLQVMRTTHGLPGQCRLVRKKHVPELEQEGVRIQQHLIHRQLRVHFPHLRWYSMKPMLLTFRPATSNISFRFLNLIRRTLFPWNNRQSFQTKFVWTNTGRNKNLQINIVERCNYLFETSTNIKSLAIKCINIVIATINLWLSILTDKVSQLNT